MILKVGGRLGAHYLRLVQRSQPDYTAPPARVHLLLRGSGVGKSYDVGSNQARDLSLADQVEAELVDVDQVYLIVKQSHAQEALGQGSIREETAPRRLYLLDIPVKATGGYRSCDTGVGTVATAGLTSLAKLVIFESCLVVAGLACYPCCTSVAGSFR